MKWVFFFFTEVGKSSILVPVPPDKTGWSFPVGLLSRRFLCKDGYYLLYSRCLSRCNNTYLSKGLENTGPLNESYVMLRDL